MVIPTFSTDLIAQLDLRFPERSPDYNDSERMLWIKVGERKVVKFLVAKLKEQEDKKASKS